jgi:hypothetical protein
MSQVIVLLHQLPETQIALRLAITEFIAAVSPLMAELAITFEDKGVGE